MLSGPEQSILLEMEESERRKVQLQSPNDRKTTKVETAKDDNEKQQYLEFDLKKRFFRRAPPKNTTTKFPLDSKMNMTMALIH